jgi:hypothetical protein
MVSNSMQFLYVAGFMFMGATEEQMQTVANSGVDHVSYILIMYSIAFVFFLFVNMLIHLYDRLSSTEDPGKPAEGEYSRVNGHAMEEGQLRDAEEFELEGLSSDEEDSEERRGHRKSEEGPSEQENGVTPAPRNQDNLL